VIFRSLPVTWGHVTSFSVTWLIPASYSLVGSQTHQSSIRPSTATSCHVMASSCELQPCKKSKASKLEFLAFYSHFQVTSGQMTSLPGNFDHVRSRDFISCHMIDYSCALPPCRKTNAQKTWVFGVLQPLPGDFWSNDVTSGSLLVTWSCDIISCHVTDSWSYRLVGSETHKTLKFTAFYTHFQELPAKWRHFQVTSGHVRSSDIISCYVTASCCELQPCRKSNAPKTQVFGLL